MLEFHQSWFYVATVSTGLVGTWGVVLAVRRRPPPVGFGVVTAAAIVAMLIQVGAGLWLLGKGAEPDGLHTFYGVVIAITFALAYVYRSQLTRRPPLSYGLLLLFVMGLGIRAWVS